jgi:hypothetical protein
MPEPLSNRTKVRQNHYPTEPKYARTIIQQNQRTPEPVSNRTKVCQNHYATEPKDARTTIQQNQSMPEPLSNRTKLCQNHYPTEPKDARTTIQQKQRTPKPLSNVTVFKFLASISSHLSLFRFPPCLPSPSSFPALSTSLCLAQLLQAA